MKLSQLLLSHFCCSEVVIHDHAGYVESRAKVLISNGVESVDSSFDFALFKIDIANLTVDSTECPTVSKLIITRIHEKNQEYKQKFFNLIEGLESDDQIQNRVTRVAPIVVPIVTAVGSTLASETIKFFFNISKRDHHEKRLTSVEKEIDALQDSLRGSICRFNSQSITNRLILIDRNFSQYINRIKLDLEKIVFSRIVSLETKIKGCLEVNKSLSAEVCLEMAKTQNFKFSVVSIEKGDEGFTLKIILEIPRIVEFASGNMVRPIGIPHTESDQRFLVYPNLPNFIVDNGELWSYSGDISNTPIQIWPERLINKNSEGPESFDSDCLALNTTKNACDAYFEKVYSEFTLQTINRQQILSTFVPCSFKPQKGPKTIFEMGIHQINGRGVLACGARALNLNHHRILPISVRIDTHSFGELNRISDIEFANIPIFDRDNPINKIPVFKGVKFYSVLMMVIAVTVILTAIGVKLALEYFALKYRSARSIASTPY